MNIALDVSPLGTGHAGRGVGVYTEQLLAALEKRNDGNTYLRFSSGQPVPVDADIVHYPYFDPFYLTLPRNSAKPFVVTVHDLTPIVLPKLFPPGLRGRIKWEFQKMNLKRARRIISDSRCSKNDIVRLTGFPAERISPVHLAPRDVFTAGSHSVDILPDFPRKYFIYVGDVNPNKNILGLLRGFGMFLERTGHRDTSLILVGKSFCNLSIPESSAIDIEIKRLGISGNVIRPGFVSDSDLVRAYVHAIALVQPSLYEGFGLPVLEAMACGCPVVSTRGGSLEEIIGPALAVASDTDSIATGLIDMISFPQNKRSKCISDGIVWAKGFSWSKVADETVAAYEHAGREN